jgi:hypothetical protein
MSLSKPMMDALLGAIADPRGTKPSDQEVHDTLVQLAEVAAAICRAMPKSGARDHFVMMFDQAMERRFSPNQGEEE